MTFAHLLSVSIIANLAESRHPHEDDGLLDVQFRPNLWESRQAWVLGVLRREGARSVLDLGCGDGTLLSSLCRPAETILDHPSDPGEPDPYGDLHVERLAGLDIAALDLSTADTGVKPPSTTSVGSLHRQVRWTELEVKLWQGSLDAYNPEFSSYEFIVSTEVIEHLPDDVLQAFAPMVLGRYRPRYLLLTTPNYSFNELFTKPGHVSPNSYPDPTGRTKRHFRHHDHKFEWTEQEFIGWCDDAATKYGYSVVVGGVGRPLVDDPFGRPTPYASQTALFTRDNGPHPAHAQIPKQEIPHKTSHVLFSSYIHEGHPMAGTHSTPAEINQRIKDLMTASQYSDMTLRELWNDEEIPLLCGGSLGVLIDAVSGDPLEWTVDAKEGEPDRMAWKVEWRMFTPLEAQPQEEYPNAWETPMDDGFDEPEEEGEGDQEVDESAVVDESLEVAETAWANDASELKDGWGAAHEWDRVESTGWDEDVGGNPWSSETLQHSGEGHGEGSGGWGAGSSNEQQ